ncbi:hypothetical protein [Thalassospira marina]|nr:hypothetical protein [Thalassospira marina]
MDKDNKCPDEFRARHDVVLFAKIMVAASAVIIGALGAARFFYDACGG